jgi:glycosyltransferase involved in cell wall biosynthesis
MMTFPRALKIAILIHPFGRFGGAERMAILHAAGLTEAGHDVTLYTDPSLMDPEWLSMLTPKVEVRRLPYGLKGQKVIRDLSKYDKLIIHHHVEPVVAMLIIRKYSDKTYWYTGEVLRAIWEDWITGEDYRKFSPTVLTTAQRFYGALSRFALAGPMYNLTVSFLRSLDLATVHGYKAIIANSQYMAGLVRNVYSYPGPMFVAYPTSSLPSSMFRPDYGNGEYVLAVGALLPNKNHRVLIEAMSLLKEPPTLRIIGEGQEKTKLKNQARRLSIDTKFDSHITGEALCRLYEGSLFVVVPSLSEPFGMTALEAALAGKPSIVTDLGGAKEFVLDKKTGFVVNPRRTDGLVSAMETLLYDRELRMSMGQRARERAVETFTPENSALALTRALNS